MGSFLILKLESVMVMTRVVLPPLPCFEGQKLFCVFISCKPGSCTTHTHTHAHAHIALVIPSPCGVVSSPMGALAQGWEHASEGM